MRRAVPLTLTLLLGLCAPAGAAPLVRVTADSGQRGARLPQSFLGVSQEYNLVEAFTGGPSGGVNQASATLMRRLSAYGGGPAVLRVGGGSADGTWWNPTGAAKPAGIFIDAFPRMALGMEMFAEAGNAKLLPALNFGHPDPTILPTEAQGFMDTLSPARLEGFELGNEPDYYPKRRLFTDADGKSVFTRPANYGPSQYAREVAKVIPKLRAITGSTPISGPATSLISTWLKALPRYARQFDVVSLHAYQLNACTQSRKNPFFASAERLVSRDPYGRLFAGLLPGVEAAQKAKLPVRITEANSVACGGKDKVSNAAAASLWTIDYLFGLWLAGASGVNLHASSPLYRPFGFARYEDGAYKDAVGAPYYGMLAFAEATANRSRMLPGVIFGAKPAPGRNVTTWGTVDTARRTVRVIILNKEAHRRGSAVVRVPGAVGRGTVKRLTSPGLSATDGIRWAGQRYAAPTDGTPLGQVSQRPVTRRSRARFVIPMAPASAALLTVKVRRIRR